MPHVGHRVGILSVLAAVLGAVGVLVAVPASALGVKINVPANRSTIQAGIDAASDGDTVIVAGGEYFEHIDFKGKAITVRGASDWRPFINGGGTGPVVVFWSGEGRDSVLSGFVITNGFPPPGAGISAGAGIAIKDASPTITRNVVTGNNAGDYAGSGIGAVGGAALIHDNEFSQNVASGLGVGGGALVQGAIEFVSNWVVDNSAGAAGGVLVGGGPVVLRHNAVMRNRATTQGGGGLSISGTGGRYVNNFIEDNTAHTRGGGVYLASGSGAYFVSNTLLGNHATAGTGFRIEAGGTTLTNNLITGPVGPSVISGASPTPPTFSHNDVYNAGPSPYDGCAPAYPAAGSARSS